MLRSVKEINLLYSLRGFVVIFISIKLIFSDEFEFALLISLEKYHIKMFLVTWDGGEDL